MLRQKYLAPITARITDMEDGNIFIPSDFADIAPISAINMSLSRLESIQHIRRIMRGIYEKPRYNKLLGERVATDPAKVASAIARKNRWSITPAQDAALNLLRLSAQVPAIWVYVSNGPYKEYYYDDDVTIIFRHTSNKETAGYSYITSLVIQGLRALGKDFAGESEIRMLQQTLSDKDKETIFREAQGTTAWIYGLIKQICKKGNT